MLAVRVPGAATEAEGHACTWVLYALRKSDRMHPHTHGASKSARTQKGKTEVRTGQMRVVTRFTNDEGKQVAKTALVPMEDQDGVASSICKRLKKTAALTSPQPSRRDDPRRPPSMPPSPPPSLPPSRRSDAT